MSNWKQGYIPEQNKNYQKPVQRPQQQNNHIQHTLSNQHYQQPIQQAPVQVQRQQTIKRTRSIPLMISFALGLLFLIVLISGTFSHADATLGKTAETMEDVGFQLGTMIGTALMIPQMIATGIAVTLNVVGWVFGGRGFSLAGAIVYCVAALLMIVNAPFLLPSIVLSFVGYSKLKNQYSKGAGGYERN